MALSDVFKPDGTCSGIVTDFGDLSEVADRIEFFLETNLPKIIVNIQPLQQGSRKLRNEKDLCAELGKRLNFAAHSELFLFYPEDPENQSATRTLDYGTYPRAHFVVGTRIVGATDRLYGLEAKRLPTHTSSIDQPAREREYVVGNWHVRPSATKNISGGIERFKEGLHGATLRRAGMIAFIQKNDSRYWSNEINRWISDLIHSSPLKSHQAKWTDSDMIIESGSEKSGVFLFRSTHERQFLPPIHITHFWLLIQSN